jgi:hypothetical protein
MVAAIAAILIILVIVYNGNGQNPNSTTNNVNLTSPTVTATSPTETQNLEPNPTSSKSTGTVFPAAPAAPSIKMIAPGSGNSRTIGVQNLISWSKAGNFSGSISLLAAPSKQFAGVILPTTGPSQTSYTWNTRDVFLSRTNPSKKDVLPGNYIIEVAFDGNNLKPIFSQAFTITN